MKTTDSSSEEVEFPDEYKLTKEQTKAIHRIGARHGISNKKALEKLIMKGYHRIKLDELEEEQ